MSATGQMSPHNTIDNDKVVIINCEFKQQWDSAEGKADVIDDDR
ncbi:hypothetical protein [Shewanella sp.]